LLLSPKHLESVDLLCKLQEVSINEAVRRAISIDCLIQSEIHKGSKVVIIDADGTEKELVFIR